MEVDRKLKTCPICGYEFAELSPAIRWTAIFLVLLILLYLII